MSFQDCYNAVRKAAEGKLSDDDIEAVIERAQQIRKRLQAENKLDGFDARLKKAIAEDANQTKLAAAIQYKNAALNALVRDRLKSHVDSLMASGVSPETAVLSVMEGTQQGVALGRRSVYATRQAYETKFIGGMLAEIERDFGHVRALQGDDDFAADVVRELTEMHDAGKPGVTKNKDALGIAKIFAKYAEMSRTELNRLGATIGRLAGWGGPHRHDQVKVAKVSRGEWVSFIKAHIDKAKTFGETADDEVDKVLGDIYQEIVSGQGNGVTTDRTGKITGPANLAKTMSKSRFLHFRDADAWLAYNERFGSGNIFSAMFSHQQRASAHAAQMQMLGPNPEVMLTSFIDEMRENIAKDMNIPSNEKAKLIEPLTIGQGGSSQTRLGQAFLEMQGMTMSPANVTVARVSQGIRTVQTLAKLGGAVITAFTTDTMTTAIASMFRGGGFWNGLQRNLGEFFAGMGDTQRREAAFLLGEGLDGIIAAIAAPRFADDGIPGFMHDLTTKFFKWNQLTGWTDTMRAAAGRTVAAEMGMRAAVSFDQLPPRYAHVLGLHGIDAKKWEAIRTAPFKTASGNSYITPDSMHAISDEALEPLIADRMAALRTKDPQKIETARQRFMRDARQELELDVGRFVADEVSFAVVETDAASRRVTLRGTRPGTASGEAWRFIMQFKGFPIAFSQRVLGRSLVGGAGDTAKARFMGNLGNTGALIVSMGVAGYMSMTMKDVLRGHWPPRDPSEVKTITAALLQGGAMGIYGDFLFGEANRFGNSILETAAGPVGSAAADIVTLYQFAIQGDAKAASALNVAIQNTPFLNLWYARPVIDTLILDAAREWASPGYRRRQERRLRKERGQELLF